MSPETEWCCIDGFYLSVFLGCVKEKEMQSILRLAKRGPDSTERDRGGTAASGAKWIRVQLGSGVSKDGEEA
jgi:hypothetical protein